MSNKVMRIGFMLCLKQTNENKTILTQANKRISENKKRVFSELIGYTAITFLINAKLPSNTKKSDAMIINFALDILYSKFIL